MKRSLPILVAVWAIVWPAQPSAQTPLTDLDSAPTTQAWQAVGRLDTGTTGFCTATLIAPELVLTAAHCVYEANTDSLLKANTLTFRAGLRNGVSVAERKVAQIAVPSGYDATLGPTVVNVRYDVALLRLARAIPTHVLDPFLVQTAPIRKGAISVVSYGQGRAEIASRQGLCRMFDAYQGVVLMDCDVTFGSSGAPVFNHKNGPPQIVSVISSIGSYQGKRATYGMVLPELVTELKQQMENKAILPQFQARRVKVGKAGSNRSTMSGAKFVRPGGS